MDVGENSAVGFYEGGVADHAHVEGHVFGCGAVSACKSEGERRA